VNPQHLLPWGSLAAAALPRGWAEAMADLAGDLAWRRAQRTRATAARNQQLVAGSSTPASVRTAFRSYARYFLGIMRLAHRTPEAALGPVHWVGIERLDRSLERGRGALVLSAHLGHWDLLGIALAQRYRDVCVFVEPLAPRSLFDFYARVRRRHGLVVSPVGAPGRHPLEVLQRNGILGLVADRPFGTRSTAVVCGHGTLHVPTGAIRSALRRGAAVHPAFAVRTRDGFRLRVGEDCASRTELPADLGTAVAVVAQAYADALQRAVSRDRDQWCLLYPVDAPTAPGALLGAA